MTNEIRLEIRFHERAKNDWYVLIVAADGPETFTIPEAAFAQITREFQFMEYDSPFGEIKFAMGGSFASKMEGFTEAKAFLAKLTESAEVSTTLGGSLKKSGTKAVLH